MAFQPQSDDSDRDPVDILADEFAARYRRGETPSITEYIRRYPEHAEQIEALFPSVALLEQLGSLSEGGGVDANSAPHGSFPPHHRIGDFEILGEIGRGGMGVVYEAVQQSLHRTVALKVLNTSSLHSANQIRRFERESQAAARLHHTNIVPVFGVGEQEGIRYYVMQRIQGLGLDAVIAELCRGARNDIHADGSGRGPRSAAARALAEVLISGELSRSSSGIQSSETRSDSMSASSWPGSSMAGHRNQGPVTGTRADEQGTRDALSGIETEPYLPSSLVLRDDLPNPLGVRSSLILRDEICGNDQLAIKSPATEGGNLASDSRGPSHSFGRRYWRNIARIGMHVAAGLQYAHSQGTLHRDIKPANILLDSNGTAWITDFGLAKVVEADNVTRTGDVVGTLRYMAPEQFQGAAHAESDVYSLGLTLFELLTLRPAYDETDRQKLIARKLTPHEPPSLRRWASEIPRDLETIVHKCLAYEADARYASAGQLLADLQAFLEDRPIQARQASPRERIWRWCRRNPAVAALSGTVAILLLVMLGLTTTGYLKEKQRAAQEATLREEADSARMQYELIAELAFREFDEIGQSFVSDDLIGTIELEDDEAAQQLQVPAYSPETAAMMERLRSAFDELAKVAGEDRRFLDYAARADLRAGELHLRLSQWTQAKDAFSRAISLYEQFEDSLDDPGIRLQLARLYNGLGVALGSLREWDAKREAEQRALSLLRDADTRPEIQFELARTHYLIGHRTSGLGPGVPGGDRSSRDERPGSPPSSAGPHARAGDSRRDHDFRRPPAVRREWDRRLDENRAHLDTAAALLRDLVAAYPAAAQYQYWLALCYLETAKQSLGSPEADLGRAQAIEILKSLAAEDPEQADYLHQLSEAYQLSYARLAERTGWGPPRIPEDALPAQVAQVEQDLREALSASDQLVVRQPHVPGYAMSNLFLLLRMVDAMLAKADYHSALEFLDRAQTRRISLVERFPESEWLAGPFESSLDLMREFVRAHLLVSEGQISEARGVLEDLINRAEEADRSDSESRGRRRRMPRSIVPVYRLLALCLERQEDHDRAAAIRDRIEQLTRDDDLRGRGPGPPRPPEAR